MFRELIEDLEKIRDKTKCQPYSYADLKFRRRFPGENPDLRTKLEIPFPDHQSILTVICAIEEQKPDKWIRHASILMTVKENGKDEPAMMGSNLTIGCLTALGFDRDDMEIKVDQNGIFHFTEPVNLQRETL